MKDFIIEKAKSLNWRHLRHLATIGVSFLLLWVGNRYATANLLTFNISEPVEVVPAVVEHIYAREENSMDMGDQVLTSVTVYFEARVTSGRRAGTIVGARQIGDPFSVIPVREVRENDKIMLANTEMGTEEKAWVLQEYIRTGPLLALAFVFMALLLLFGGIKGFNTIVSLGLTCGAVFAVFIPLILSGFPIYLATFLVCIYIIGMTLALVNGYNLKSLSAAVGCMAGLLVAGGLAWIMDFFLKLTGYLNEESAFLLYLNSETPLDLKAIIFSGILLGALGATMDVAVSMAASLHELKATSPELGFSALVRSGFNIGRDILGTMTNTLILAYIGSSLSLSLLLIVYSNSLMELLNREQIVVEILQALVGSVGLLCAIPLTTFFAAWAYTHKGRQAS